LVRNNRACSILTGCNDEGIVSARKACLGADHDSLVETLNGQSKKGDIVATKKTASLFPEKLSP